MPPISPCGRVVDYVRSCQRGFWRFFADRPDIITPGYLYFCAADTHSIEGPHSFGSAVWLKDGMIYPEFPTGQLVRAGTQWYNGDPPDPVPPDQQIFDTAAFNANNTWPVVPPIKVVNGFDERCFVISHPGVELDIDTFLRPDVTDCCWQRFLARLLDLLTDSIPGDLAKFELAVSQMWPDYILNIFDDGSAVDRFAWLVGARFQIVFRLGTQSWQELITQSFHLNIPSSNMGAFSTSRDWFDLASDQLDQLNDAGWNPNKPITFVGHSKGGAVQWILARRMLEDNPDRDIECLTFGIPKVGDARMVELGGINRARHVIHVLDPIPLLPPNPLLWPLLEVAFAWLDVHLFGTWQNFPVYQITGVGFGNEMRPAGNLALETVIAWITRLRLGLAIDPVAQHELTSYVAALADCCAAVQFPFNDTVWETLFGEADNGLGGGMWGGAGELPAARGAGGLAIGDIFPGPFGMGGMKIGGGGVIVITHPSAILLESGFYILKEDGFVILLE